MRPQAGRVSGDHGERERRRSAAGLAPTLVRITAVALAAAAVVAIVTNPRGAGARDVTGADRYLEPVPRAVAWLARSRLPDGRLARFYELGTNRPLSMTKKYPLTPADDDLPTHYGFEVKATIESLEKALAEVCGPAGPPRPRPRHAGPKKPKGDAARKLSSDDRQHGPDGVISSATFIKNIGTLAEYLAATGTSD